ncbi:MAG TPA: DUF2911 domain-containing protein [Acidobacteriaceae bacterium]|nr:DUF2911 domain-containing protein [Acidobacteriaceae bacterium]
MKRFVLSLGLLALALPLGAQNQNMPPKSPPANATGVVGGHSITIKYSSPRVRGREGHIFGPGGLIQKTHKEYPVWRAGANAATTLDTDADLTIGDLTVPKGTYTLFVDISNPDQWTLIVSKQTGEWGLAYNSADDLGRVPMQMSQPPQMIEDLKWDVKNEGHGRGRLTLGWEDHVASVSFRVSQ